MKQIQNFKLDKLRNDEHQQFVTDVLAAAEANATVIVGVEDVFDPFKQAVTAEIECQKAEQGSAVTKNLIEADDYRDRLFKGLQMGVDAHQYHYDDTVCESARRLMRVFDLYGDLRSKPYKEESAALTNLVHDLKGEAYSADVTLLSKAEWITKLGEANDGFIAKFDERASELSARSMGAARAARATTDPAYKVFIDKINAAAVFKGEEVYAVFIDKVNYLIDYTKSTIAARQGRAQSAVNATVAKSEN
ncbi:MAG: DUF6261 family protein [Bacteroidota bacterium]|nr:DUF6261 family protein [Bacteroidota bacterium]